MSIPISLGKLELSAMNVRQADDGSGTADLEASIAAIGLLLPLIVHTIVGVPKAKARYGVLAGGRRLRALQAMQARGEVPKDHPVECVIREDDDVTSTEISMIENTARVALTPVQEFRAFAHLAERGADIATIARHFNTTELHVRQRMRLGQLHPTILAALDARAISQDAAKAYASTADQALQMTVFDENTGSGSGHHAYAIRRSIQRAASAYDTEKMLQLIGVEAYTAAGGQLEEDLFTGAQRVLQPGTLSELYFARIEAEKEKLAASMPANVTITTDATGCDYRLRVETTPVVTTQQAKRLGEIDDRCDEITTRLDELGEPDPEHDGDDVRVIATNPADQAAVDALLSEMNVLEAESEAISAQAEAPALPDEPLAAYVAIEDGALKVRGFYRIDAEPAGGSASTPANGAEPRQTPEQRAKAEHGLTLDGIEVMRVQRRSILRAMMVTRETPDSSRTAGDYLTFSLLRSVLASGGYGQAAQLGITGFTTSGSQVAQPDVQAQPAAYVWRAALEWVTAADWMTERDPQVAFASFCELDVDDRDFALAIAAGLMLEKPLNLPGYEVPAHDQIAFLLGSEHDEQVRDLWKPSTAFFDRLPKKWRIAAVEQVNPTIAKKIAKLPNGDISAACARFFEADHDAQREFGMMPGTVAHARRWVPQYLRFESGPTERRLFEDALDREAKPQDAVERREAA